MVRAEREHSVVLIADLRPCIYSSQYLTRVRPLSLTEQGTSVWSAVSAEDRPAPPLLGAGCRPRRAARTQPFKPRRRPTPRVRRPARERAACSPRRSSRAARQRRRSPTRRAPAPHETTGHGPVVSTAKKSRTARSCTPKTQPRCSRDVSCTSALHRSAISLLPPPLPASPPSSLLRLRLTSSPKSGWRDCRSATESSVNAQLLSSASCTWCAPCCVSCTAATLLPLQLLSAGCTARPATWCVSRKGTPLRTRYLPAGGAVSGCPHGARPCAREALVRWCAGALVRWCGYECRAHSERSVASMNELSAPVRSSRGDLAPLTPRLAGAGEEAVARRACAPPLAAASLARRR